VRRHPCGDAVEDGRHGHPHRGQDAGDLPRQAAVLRVAEDPQGVAGAGRQRGARVLHEGRARARAAVTASRTGTGAGKSKSKSMSTGRGTSAGGAAGGPATMRKPPRRTAPAHKAHELTWRARLRRDWPLLVMNLPMLLIVVAFWWIPALGNVIA